MEDRREWVLWGLKVDGRGRWGVCEEGNGLKSV